MRVANAPTELSHCPHCGGKRAILVKANVDHGAIQAPLYRCANLSCGKEFYQLTRDDTIPTTRRKAGRGRR